MEVADYVNQLAIDGPRLGAAAASAGLDSDVPSCPTWVVRDLIRHLGGVHRWATAIVGGPRTEAWDVELDEVVGTWPPDGALVEWFLEGHAALVAVLSGADPDLECWTFLPASSALTMWARRQAHETAVHRVDGELANGAPPMPFPPPFAADGIDELLYCFITRRRSRASPVDSSRTFRFRCTDTRGEWLVRVSADGVETGREPGGPADCEIAGAASDLYLALWSRRPIDGLAIHGDRGAVEEFLAQVNIRWS